MSKKIRTHYDNLKIASDAPDAVIKAAHKALAQKHHPDKSENKDESHRIIKLINEARDVLLNPTLRKEHDDWIKSQEVNFHDQETKVHKPQTVQKTENVWQKIGKYKVREGLATDIETGLMWLRFSIGQRWENDTVQGEAKTVSWDNAFSLVKDFNRAGGYDGYTDWLIPTIDELETLLDHYEGNENKRISFINNVAFPKNPSFVWSVSEDASFSNDGGRTTDVVSVVNFHAGKRSFNLKDGKDCVRLVRNRQ